MNDRASSDAEKRVESATEDARAAKRELDDANPGVEKALAADVEDATGVDAVAHPGAESDRGEDLTGPGAPMP